MLQEIHLLEQKILGIEHQLNALTRDDVRVQQLRRQLEHTSRLVYAELHSPTLR
jgi:small-conductance mechanosensitive channel